MIDHRKIKFNLILWRSIEVEFSTKGGTKDKRKNEIDNLSSLLIFYLSFSRILAIDSESSNEPLGARRKPKHK